MVHRTTSTLTPSSVNHVADRPRFSDREELPLPDKPPYTAHLGNLTYDVTSVDIETFLKDCKVTNVRIVEDKLDHKPKGFGYVEFATLEGLKLALTFSESNFMGRNVKISIAEPRTFIVRDYSTGTDLPLAKDRESTRDFSDWSRKGPLPDLPQNTRQPSRGFGAPRNFDNMSDAGSERGGSRRGFFESDNKVRDFSNWERKGPLSPPPSTAPTREGGGFREGAPPMERRQSPAWGEARTEGSRPPRKEFEPRPPVERIPTAAEQDTQWRARMQPDRSPAPTPDVSTPSSPQQQAPKERPRLNLAKRTVSTAVDAPAASTTSDSKASPFGAAKPIDTAARDREVEEKRELAIRSKKEAEEKEKADKIAKEAAARAARADRADQGQAQEDTGVTSPGPEAGKIRKPSRQQNGAKPVPNQNGEAAPQAAKPSFKVLRRDTDGGDDGEGVPAEGEEDAEVPANGSAIAPEPTEVVKEVDATGTPDAEGTAEVLEDDGWSTVPAKGKSARRGGQRAVAS